MIFNTKIVALCIAKVYEEENIKLISAINNRLFDNGYRLFIYNTCTDLFWGNRSEIGEKDVFNLIDFTVIDALIVCDNIIKDKTLIEKLITKARSYDIPVFSLDGIHEGCINITFDYDSGFELVVRHVTDFHKCSKIHYMAGMRGNTFSENRRRIVKKVLSEKDIKFGRDNISYGDFWADPTKLAIERIINSKKLPEAVICANDAMALTVSQTLIDNGIRVPEDVIVTGFDGVVNINFSKPRITSSSYNYDEMGEMICQLLEKCAKGEDCVGDYKVGFTLILHESCGCTGGKSISPSKYIENLTSSFYRYQSDECSIYNHVANIYCCETLDDICMEMAKLNWYGMFVMLNQECTDNTFNPLSTVEEGERVDDMCLLYKYNHEFRPTSFKRKSIAPDLDYLLTLNNPIVFNSLNFQNIPLGYVCFFFDDLVKEYCRIPQIVNALNVAVGGYRNLQYQKFLANKIEEISRTDTLTGLYNRKGFSDMLKNSATLFKDCEAVTVLSADLDGLKYINDNFGHSEGDFAIKTAGDALMAVLPDIKICARFGGDEFAGITSTLCSDRIRDCVYRYLDEFNENSGKDYKISMSIGAYDYKFSTEKNISGIDEILKDADKLMYMEKYNKPNRRK